MGWQLSEYVDPGVSGAKEGHPELSRLLRDAKRWQIDSSSAGGWIVSGGACGTLFCCSTNSRHSA
jgi:hypothetical protein